MTYKHCKECHKRMRKFREDSHGGRAFYVCPSCGSRWTFLRDRNFLSEEWPQNVIDDAARRRVLTKNGRVL